MQDVKANLLAAGYSLAASGLYASDVDLRFARAAWREHHATGRFLGVDGRSFKAPELLKNRPKVD